MFKVDTQSNKLNRVVEIVDSCMGTSKTTNILKWIDNNPNTKFIFVSPLLSEVQEGGRIHRDLNSVVFEVPIDDKGTKSDSFLNLLEQGCNIACTHSLYLCMTEKHLKEIHNQGYTVIIDEEIDIIGGFDKYSDNDLLWLLSKNEISIDEHDGMVSWIGDREGIKPNHKYYDFLKYCNSKSLYSTKRSSTMMVTQLPVRLFEVAERVIILTYMFKGNVLDCFLKLKGFECHTFNEVTCTQVDKKHIKNLLTVLPPNKNIINYSLSSTWWLEANGEQIKQVKSYIESCARKNGMLSNDVCWTLPKMRSVKTGNANKNLVKPKGYTKDSGGNPCYLSANTRATNDYAHKKMMIHCYNRYPIQSVKAYLQDYGYPIDNNVFALSEMLQWIWRGCIRKGEPMFVAIGSKRMYNLFVDWLNDEFEGAV